MEIVTTPTMSERMTKADSRVKLKKKRSDSMGLPSGSRHMYSGKLPSTVLRYVTDAFPSSSRKGSPVSGSRRGDRKSRARGSGPPYTSHPPVDVKHDEPCERVAHRRDQDGHRQIAKMGRIVPLASCRCGRFGCSFIHSFIKYVRTDRQTDRQAGMRSAGP